MSRESKFLSRVLRHEPELAGLKIAPGGWVTVTDLLRGLKKAGHPLSLGELITLVAENDKQRFTLSPDGQKIRAAQGHSLVIDLDLPPRTPPVMLWHGTASANLDAIFADGLKPGRRQHVHLSADAATALRVGQRHGRAVVLTIRAGEMYDNGHMFWQADNGVWLTKGVPPAFIGFG